MRPAAEPAVAFVARVSGRVQGVGFRYSALERARFLGLAGWVRNEDDGSVETRFEGTKRACEAYAAWLHRGPPGARVDEVVIHPSAPTGAWSDFSVEH
ncbi:MAG TPA: acylphosphatase [Spirochaetales bacterium]|nr:acylphosphatase [Spirochaetales bacterium]